MRLIDADKLIDYTDDRYSLHEIGRRERDDIVWALESAPTVDAAPVRHGRWIKYTGTGKVQWMCSECSAEEKNPKVANWCYHCGARMDGIQ